jgi:undecaprenyl-phosphate 4-deoxy-4-formamido-L-arabinose transferase
LILVDDGSTDGTWAEVERLHAADPRVHAVRFKRNFGQHPAMHAGLARARGDIVVTMDGDLQNQPEDIPRLVAAVEGGADVASGRRAARNDSWGRTLPSRLINGMLRRFTGVEIADFGCAFNAYRRTSSSRCCPRSESRSSRRRSSSPAVPRSWRWMSAIRRARAARATRLCA